MKKKIRFKYENDIGEYYSHEELIEDSEIVESPLPYKSVPDGKYTVIGDKQFHRKEFWVKDNIWYLMTILTEDKNQIKCNAAVFRTFPNLSYKEWEQLKKVKKYLKPQWQFYLKVYKYYCELEKLIKNTSRKCKATLYL